MDDATFDHLARFLGVATSRRTSLLAALVAAPWWSAPDVAAGPGCKNVGKRCQTKTDCCSNVCRGKKGKKTCRAHDTGGCKAGAIEAFCGGANVTCTSSQGFSGFCNTTTGNAGYCSREGTCLPCTRDTECQDELGAGAACVTCATCPNGRGCASPAPIP